MINLTSIDHPMHLHGFYYRIDAKGDGARDYVARAGERRMVVTEIVGPGETMAMSFLPDRRRQLDLPLSLRGPLSHHVAMDTEKGVAAPRTTRTTWPTRRIRCTDS